MGMEKNTQKILLREFKRLFEPITLIAGDSNAILELLEFLGWDINDVLENDISNLVDSLSVIANYLDEIQSWIDSPPQSLGDFQEALQEAREITKVVYNLSKSGDGLEIEQLKKLPEELLKDLFVLYLQRTSLPLYEFFRLIGVLRPREIEPEATEDVLVYFPSPLPTIDFKQIIRLLRDPQEELRKLYVPNGLQTQDNAIEIANCLFPSLVSFLSQIGIDTLAGTGVGTSSGLPSNPMISAEEEKLLKATLTASRRFRLRSGVSIVRAMVVLIAAEQGGPGVLLVLEGQLDWSGKRNQWHYLTKCDVGPGSILIKKEGVDFALPESRINVGFALTRKTESNNTIMLGSTTESRLEIGQICLQAETVFEQSKAHIGIDLILKECAFVFQFEGDGFLQNVLPKDGFRTDFDFGIGYSSLNGFHFSGGAGLDVTLPLHISLGVLKIQTTSLAILLNEEESLSILIGSSIEAELGPVVASINRIGCKSRIDFPKQGGNLGPVNFEVPSFLPPNGVLLAINTSGITGSGFLEFDYANHRYTGALALNFSEFSLTAIGLITTQLPDGSDGFALLISICTIFNPPIQLTMGFTLTGVGGLIGVNRSMEVDALRKRLKTGSLDSILFPNPESFVKDSGEIISNLRAVFPPTEDQYVVGPMVQISWGRQSILTANLGILIEFPDPVRIAVLGTLDAALPSADEALVMTHLDVLGCIDFAKQELWFKASLYDSRILTFTLYGDAAFFLSWGHNPRFVLSLGGFHPHFPIPADLFADMRRLTLCLSESKNFQLNCQSYLAITSNSVQFGSQANLYAKKGKFSATGHLGFDALIYLSPFSFEVEIRAGIQVKYGSLSLFGLGLTLFLAGPAQWIARGKVRISLLFFSIKVGFRFTWGSKEAVVLPVVDPWVRGTEQSLLDALEDPNNWGSLLPPGQSMAVALRSTEEDVVPDSQGQKPLVLSAAGRLEVRQNLLPLDTPLEKIGAAPMTDAYDSFTITAIKVGTEDLTDGPIEDQLTQDYFARGQYEHLTTDQQLSVPAFERMPNGITTVASKSLAIPDEPLECETVAYETVVIKPDETTHRPSTPGRLPWKDAQHLVQARARRRGQQRLGPNKRFSVRQHRPAIQVQEERFCVADKITLTRADTEIDQRTLLSRIEADWRLQQHTALHPEQAETLAVVPNYELQEVP
jgi:hypothetical protein